MKSEKMGELLADALILKHSKEDDLDWYKEQFPNTDEVILLRESFVYELFLMVMALELHFKENKEGPETAEYFNVYFSKKLIDASFFKDYSEYKAFSQPRIEAYNKASRENKEPNYIYWISKTFCGYCGDDADPAKIFGISTAFPLSLKANLEFIQNLEKHIASNDD